MRKQGEQDGKLGELRHLRELSEQVPQSAPPFVCV